MKRKIIKWGLIILFSGLVIGGGIIYYLFNMPHRDVQSTAIDYKIETTTLVEEYLADAKAANKKYLQAEGDSKILAVTGIVESITEDMKQQKIVLLKGVNDKAGVRCTFMNTTNANAAGLKKGDVVTIKGVIRSGASYDADLEMYENVIMENCDVIKNN